MCCGGRVYAWILWSLSAAACFTACNEAISLITANAGPLCIFYFAPGTVAVGTVYQLIMCIYNSRQQQKCICWNEQKLIIDNKVDCKNVLGFVAFCFNYFLIQNMAFLTMWFAALADINVGVITVIWSVNPLFMAIMDWIIYKVSLECYHLAGTLAIVACTIILSLAGVLMPAHEQPKLEQDELLEVNPHSAKVMFSRDRLKMPTWVPVLFGVLTPVFFTINGMLTKHLTGHRRKGAKPLTSEEKRRVFAPDNLSFTSYIVVNIIVLVAAIPYWVLYDFDESLFWTGIIGSVINTLGLVSVQNALSTGPTGPVSALTTV